MRSEQENYQFLTQGKIQRVITTMAVPTIIAMLVTAIYNIADTFFVGRISTEATAAVGVAFSMMFLIQAVSFFFGNGSGNYISRELGAKRHRNAEIMATTSFFYAIAVGLVIAVAGLVLLNPLCIWLGSTPTILNDTRQYLGIVLLGTPFTIGGFTLNNQLRFEGNAALGMRGILVGAFANILLDPILIFVFDLGVAGAAIATVIGQFLSFMILLRMVNGVGSIPIRWSNFSKESVYIKEIFAGGTPSISRQGLTAIAAVLLNHAAANYGDAAIAAMSIVNRFTMVVLAGVIGFGQGFQPFCGFCYGAGLYKRVKSGFWFSVNVTTVFLVVCSVLGWLFTDAIIAVFRNDPYVISVGTNALRWQLVSIPFYGLLIMANMLTQTTRKTIRANILAAARTGIFFVPLILILPHCYGLRGVEMCQAVSDFFSILITIPILWSAFREMPTHAT